MAAVSNMFTQALPSVRSGRRDQNQWLTHRCLIIPLNREVPLMSLSLNFPPPNLATLEPPTAFLYFGRMEKTFMFGWIAPFPSQVLECGDCKLTCPWCHSTRFG